MIKKGTVLIVGLLLLFAGNTHAQLKKNTDTYKTKYNTVGSKLPPLRIQTLAGKITTNNDIKINNHLFVVIFNPDCGSCEDVGKMLHKNAAILKNTPVLMMTYNDLGPELPKFLQTTELNKNKEITIGLDQAGAINQLANYGHLPLINVYDKNRTLIKTFNGNTSIEQLKKYL